MIIKDRDDNIVEEVYLNHACLAENVYDGDRMLNGKYTWQAIITKKKIKAVRIGPNDKDFTYNSINNRNDYHKVEIVENNSTYKRITDDELFDIMNNKCPKILCETNYKFDGRSITILYQGDYINFNIEKKNINLILVLY